MNQDSSTNTVSPANSNAFQDNTSQAHQLAVQTQIMQQWAASMHNPYAMQIHSSSIPQQQHSHHPNGQAIATGVQQNPQPNNSTPMFPPNVVNNLFRMAHPVGSSPDDDSVLAHALRESEMNGTTYKQAMDGLHGKNNHSASLWKDYYLDHLPRIKLLISRLSATPVRTVKKPFATVPSHTKIEDGVSLPRSSGRAHPTIKPRSIIPSQKLSSGRGTINSITAPLLPSTSSSDVTVPDMPSREPSAPSEIIAFSQKGNMFTKNDTDFMLKFISWELKHNPNLTKGSLCNKLETKAPHHTHRSWRQHMHNIGSVVDKTIAAACADRSDSEEGNTQVKIKLEPDAQWQAGFDSGAIAAEFEEDSADDEINMGLPGKYYTAADKRLIAKYIATTDDWDSLEHPARFANFYTRFPHRALTSWARYYTRNETGIDHLAKKYKQRAEERASVIAQRVQPSWGSDSSGGSLPSALKRKFGSGEFEKSNPGFGPKRPKGYADDSAVGT